MDWDVPQKQSAGQVRVGEPLDRLSISELENRIQLLESEIDRVREELRKKRSHEADAAAIFKT